MIHTTEQKVRMSDKIRVYPRSNINKQTPSVFLKTFCEHSETDEVIHETHDNGTQLMFVSCRFVCLVDKPAYAHA